VGKVELSTAPQKFLTPCAADAGPDRGASEEPIRRRSVASEQRRTGPADASSWVWNFRGAVLSRVQDSGFKSQDFTSPPLPSAFARV